MPVHGEFRDLLSGGDRRSIADSQRVRALIEQRPSRIKTLAALTANEDWLVSQRALTCWKAGARASRMGRAVQKGVHRLFRWTAAESKRMERILLENVTFPQTFVRAWALDSLATLSEWLAERL